MVNPFAKINVFPIIKNYIFIFKKNQEKSYSKGSLFLFFVFPLIIGILLPSLGVTVSVNLSGLLLGLYSIFAGLFFSFQIFIFEIVSKIVDLKLTQKSSNLRINKFEYIANSIFFSILICIAGLFTLLLLSIFYNNKIIILILSGISFYLLILFVFNLLMDLKGIYILLSEEIAIQRKAIEDQDQAEGVVVARV